MLCHRPIECKDNLVYRSCCPPWANIGQRASAPKHAGAAAVGQTPGSCNAIPAPCRRPGTYIGGKYAPCPCSICVCKNERRIKRICGYRKTMTAFSHTEHVPIATAFPPPHSAHTRRLALTIVKKKSTIPQNCTFVSPGFVAANLLMVNSIVNVCLT